MGVRQLRKCCVVTIMVLLQIMSLVCATSRPIASTNVSYLPEIKSPQPAKESYKRPIMKPNEKKEMKRGRRRIIGSKPPSCEKKCYRYESCEAIQVPTISSIPQLSPHYANYQPEGWRCHCAP